jgi:hypothetical protein
LELGNSTYFAQHGNHLIRAHRTEGSMKKKQAPCLVPRMNSFPERRELVLFIVAGRRYPVVRK